MQRIGAMTDGGVDYSFECAGNLEVLREAFLSTHTVRPFLLMSASGLPVSISIKRRNQLLPLLLITSIKSSMQDCMWMDFKSITLDMQGWGLTVLLGIHPSPMLLPLHPMELFNGRQIIGSIFGGFKGKTQLPKFAKQCMCGVSYSNPATFFV